jgi:thioester reductase-like protein
VILGRRGPDSEVQRADLERMRAAGARVHVHAVDVADRDALAAMLAGLPAPLRGVVHAAGVLGEVALRELTAEDFARVMAPKARGGWNLHELTADAPLDFFVLFGSLSAVLGAPGQAHYAAANAWLAGLTHLRRRAGLPATCLEWGPVSEVGMAARDDVRERFARMGIRYITPATMLDAIDRALEAGVDQAAIVELEPGATGLSASPRPYLAELRTGLHATSGLRAELVALVGSARRERLAAWLREQIAAIVGSAPEVIAASASFSDLGLDSLMALELRNRIQQHLGLSLSATVALSHDSAARLAEHLEGRLDDGALTGAADDEAGSLALDALRERAHLPDDVRPGWDGAPRVPAERALVTGITGFIGAYVARALLERGVAVEAIVRAPSAADARQRAVAALHRYGGWSDAWAPRLDVRVGDMASPRLGLSDHDHAALADGVDLVIHAAAHVHWVLPYRALEPTNVGGMQAVLRLCCAGRPKALAFVSTLGTVGVYAAMGTRPPGTDPDARMPRTPHTNGYFQSKWVAEQLAHAARERGLPVTVIRPGLVVGHSRTGVDSTTSGQFFCSLVKGCVQLGVAPRWAGSLRIVPVDFVASAVVELALCPAARDADVNLTNHRALPFAELADALRSEGWLVLEEPYSQWHADVLALPTQAPDNALAPFAPFLRPLSDEDTAIDVFSARDPLDDARTRELLQACGLACPPADVALVRTCVRWYVETGVLPPPKHDLRDWLLLRERGSTPAVPARFEPEALLRAAMESEGADTDAALGPEPDALRDALAHYAESVEHDARPHGLGRIYLYERIFRMSLVARLRLVPWLQPGARPRRAPLVVCGLPRSGTTLLHRLLALADDAAGIPLWQLLEPIPPQHGPDLRREHAERNLEWLGRLVPVSLDAQHLVRPELPDECGHLLRVSFMGAMPWQVPAHGWLRWSLRADPGPAYRVWAAFLAVLEPEGRRLVLKDPFHAGNLAALLAACPEARVVQTHRDPVEVVPSFHKLATTMHRVLVPELDLPRTVATHMEWLDVLVDRNAQARAALPPDRLVDVDYRALVADPLGQVARIHDALGLPLGAAHEQRIARWIAEHPQREHGPNPCAAADYGQTDAEIRERFSGYRRRFGLE